MSSSATAGDNDEDGDVVVSSRAYLPGGGPLDDPHHLVCVSSAHISALLRLMINERK